MIFLTCFIVESFFLVEPCRILACKTCIIAAYCYFTFICDKSVLNRIFALLVKNFINNGALSYYANPLKNFYWVTLRKTDGKIQIARSQGLHHNSTSLTSVYFWFGGCFKFLLHHSSLSTLVEHKDSNYSKVSTIYSDMLHSDLTGALSRLNSVV